MTSRSVSTAWIAVCVLSLMKLVSGDGKPYEYTYDQADKTIEATLLRNPDYYDADIVADGKNLWLTWLEFIPGVGDYIWFGCQSSSEWTLRSRLTHGVGDRFANPTLTIDSEKKLWLSYEAESDGCWHIFLMQHEEGSTFSHARRITSSPGPNIQHRVAVDPAGGLWMVWQGVRNGQFDVVACHVTGSKVSTPYTVSQSSPRGDWDPAVAVTSDGTVYVVWDAYDGDTFNVYARIYRHGEWGDTISIAAGPGFEGKTDIAAGPDDHVWILWEEGGRNWGKKFHRGLMPITETCGSLHRFRALHLAQLDADGTVGYLKTQLPMPMFDQAIARPDAPAGSERVGCYYERGKITVDRLGRLWVVYRHFYAPEFLGARKFDEDNVEHACAIFARYLEGTEFSKLYRFDIKQGDGAQRLAITPLGNGIAALWTTGRTHRNFEPINDLGGDRDLSHVPRGLALATVTANGGSPTGQLATTAPAQRAALLATHPPEHPPGTTLAGKSYRLFYGELHRHTDLSRCYALADGSLDDAFRYAIDAAGLDFVGITDHACDLNWGNPAGQVWWRTCKANDRHHLRAAFAPLYAFEHSRNYSSLGIRETDHNVISLRRDMLRPEVIGYPELCSQMSDDTFMIPHAPINSHKHSIWDFWPQPRNRPLLEIYQGFRHQMTGRNEQVAADGLERGHRFGFIGSTDHLATAAGYACVWAADCSRESIFRALQNRRTFAATSKIRLIVRAGDRWMGEEIVASSMPAIQIEADAEVPFEKIEIILDGKVVKSLPTDKRSISLTYEPGPTAPGAHYLYVRLTQIDASLAWSSPIFIEVQM